MISNPPDLNEAFLCLFQAIRHMGIRQETADKLISLIQSTIEVAIAAHIDIDEVKQRDKSERAIREAYERMQANGEFDDEQPRKWTSNGRRQ